MLNLFKSKMKSHSSLIISTSDKPIEVTIRSLSKPRNFKIALVGVVESKNHLFFKEEELEEMSSIIKNGSWGLSMYYFKGLYSIYLKHYPEIQSIQVESIEPEKEETENVEPDDVLDEIEEEIDVQELIGENEKLSEDLNQLLVKF